MSAQLSGVIEAFAGRRVLVLGDAMLDSYLEGAAARLCPEAPVPVVDVRRRDDLPGGAANTASNVRQLGAQVSLLSVIGDDAEGELLKEALAARGVSADSLLVEPGRRTIVKQRVVCDHQVLVRFDMGTTARIATAIEEALIERLDSAAAACDALIVSDYDYGIVTPAVLRALATRQRRHPRLLVVDSKKLGEFRGLGATAVKPNYQEAARLLGEPELLDSVDRAGQMESGGVRLLGKLDAEVVALTLDSDGALIFERGKPLHRTYARPSPHRRAAGAGDTFVAAFTLALAAGADTPAAAELASAASTVVVGKERTAVCSAQELRGYFSFEEAYLDEGRLADRLEFHRRQGRRIVFTNGCFDILHRGHIGYLNQAKALGDVLVVAVNSDESVRRLKGAGRPLNSLEDRVEVLAALSCIDHIVSFSEDTPSRLIEMARPDVFVKGGDYTHEMLPEAPLVECLGGSVQILPYLEDRSTSRLIEGIRERVRQEEGLLRAQELERSAGGAGDLGGS
ncbi:MAG: D-glycero-beta-D-manno-heptose 1-phosphate adenylyltransferase [Actinomycetota bacterium]|nr:D-glycero-beta-D-manno-heptose 1-phosphate adenylyltransferase [Actinomycetota bacterium]